MAICFFSATRAPPTSALFSARPAKDSPSRPSLSGQIGSLVSEEFPLKSLVRAVHTLHTWWRWRQDASLLYDYVENPVLALGDLAVAQNFQGPLFAKVALVLASIKSLWQAEKARTLLLKHWCDLKKELREIRQVPFHPALYEPGFYTLFFSVALKVQTLFFLSSALFYQSFCISMHMIDFYKYFSEEKEQERARSRFASNASFLHKEGKEILASFCNQDPLPFFDQVQLKRQYIETLCDLLQSMEKTSRSLFHE